MFDTEFRPEQIHPSVFVGQGTAMVDVSALQRYRPFIDDWPAF